MKKRGWRYFFFILAILAGFAGGLGYGWGINPVQYRNTSPHTLKVDYQADYILMVAELYNAEKDLPLALARLDFLGNAAPLDLLNTAISFAVDRQYAQPDLQLMQKLAFDVQQALDR